MVDTPRTLRPCYRFMHRSNKTSLPLRLFLGNICCTMLMLGDPDNLWQDANRRKQTDHSLVVPRITQTFTLGNSTKQGADPCPTKTNKFHYDNLNMSNWMGYKENTCYFMLVSFLTWILTDLTHTVQMLRLYSNSELQTIETNDVKSERRLETLNTNNLQVIYWDEHYE